MNAKPTLNIPEAGTIIFFLLIISWLPLILESNFIFFSALGLVVPMTMTIGFFVFEFYFQKIAKKYRYENGEAKRPCIRLIKEIAGKYDESLSVKEADNIWISFIDQYMSNGARERITRKWREIRSKFTLDRGIIFAGILAFFSVIAPFIKSYIYRKLGLLSIILWAIIGLIEIIGGIKWFSSLKEEREEMNKFEAIYIDRKKLEKHIRNYFNLKL